MKRLSVFCFTLFLIIFALGACADDIADTSENVEFVSASYYMAETESSDRLRKTAELAYSKMEVTPKSGMTVKGISFDAKLKEGQQQDFSIRVYAIKQGDTDSGNILLAEKNITISDNYNTLTADFESPYSFTVFDGKLSEKDGMSIEFYCGGVLNSGILFSINNVVLLS